MKTIGLALVAMLLTACMGNYYRVDVIPNYDAMVGARFSDVIPNGKFYDRASETPEQNEFRLARPDGCATSFFVRKSDGVILAWKVSPTPEQCPVRRHPLNV